MKKNKVQFLLILSARMLDAIVLFVIYPKLFSHFGLEFAKISQFMSIVSVAVITVKLGFDSVIILSHKNENPQSDRYIRSILLSKLILSVPTIFLAAIYNFHMQSLIEPWTLIVLITLACVSEILNFSQLTLINKNAVWIFAFNLAKAFILLLGVEAILSHSRIEAFLWLHVMLLLSVSVAHFFLNRVYKVNFLQANISNVLPILNSSLKFFMLRIFSLMSDKIVLLLSIPIISKADLIILELFVKFIALFAVPTFIFFNFVRSRSLFINKYVLVALLFALSTLSGIFFSSYVFLFDYLELASYSAEDLFWVSSLLIVTVLLSQAMIYASDFSAIRPDRETGSIFINFLIFSLPLLTFLVVDKAGIFFPIIILNTLYAAGISSYITKNFLMRRE